jgi:uncharacterized protein (DUF927 family)
MEQQETQQPKVSLEEAREFVGLLTGSADTPVTFQTFSESKAAKAARRLKHDPLARTFHGPLSEHAATLQALNEAGAGVFLTINETDLQGRQKENVTRVRAVFLDFDEPAADPFRVIKEMALEPHIVVESSPNKAHAYCLVRDCGLEDFGPLQAALQARYGGDPKVKDLPRVMRLPGFLHVKEEAPFLTRIVEAHDAPPYSVADIRRRLIGEEAMVRAANSRAKVATTTATPASTSAELANIRAALAVLPDGLWDDREFWLRIGMALHSFGARGDCLDIAYELWCEAGKVSNKFDETDNAETWASLKDKRDGVTLATLYHEAQKHGFILPRASRFRNEEDGVYYRGIDKHGDLLPPLRICGPLVVAAQATDHRGGNWGLLLEFEDLRGTKQHWVMPRGMLASDAAEVRAELLNRGLWIGTNKVAREQLTNYLNKDEDLPRATYVTAPGWHGKAYVLADRAIGAESHQRIVFQGAAQSRLEQRGTAEEWRDAVSVLAVGNSRLAFAISTAFAAPLLHLVGADGGGFHFGGDSSQGKTSIVRAAASVWGGPPYVHSWRATSNGLEGLAQQHNDGLLVLDELNQVEPREAGEAAYMLANGRGKARAGRGGAARPIVTWRLLYLSTGELGLAAHMAKAGHRVEAGQAVRLAEISADAEREYGIYESVHRRANGAVLSAELVAAASKTYGTVGLRFLELVAAQYEDISATVLELTSRFSAELLSKGAEGQDHRSAARFALVAAAGAIATRLGLTGWPEEQAFEAAKLCFRAWQDARGGAGNQERRAILHQVRRFLELHGKSRFSRKDGRDTERVVTNRAGFYDELEDGTWFYVLPEAYTSEVCQGRVSRAVSKVLIAERWLVPDGEGKSARSMNLPGVGQARCYVFSPRALQADIE